MDFFICYLLDGIQLLYLIDQGINASKYLVSHGQRMKSVEYSKVLCKHITIVYHLSLKHQPIIVITWNVGMVVRVAGTLSSVYLFPRPNFIRVK